MSCTKCFTRCEGCTDCHAAEIEAKDKEIEALKAQIAAMRRCEICKHWDTDCDSAPCVGCADKTDLPRWELAK